MSHEVFISYSSPDQNAALAVLHGLESDGIRCWMAPRDIKPGTVWAQAIMDGIAGCRIMVVVFSASANRSSHVLNEVDAAVRKGAIVIPFRIENVMPEGAMEYHLRTRHWLDALTPDLTEFVAVLGEQIRVLLQGGAPGPAMTPPPKPMPPDLPKRGVPVKARSSRKPLRMKALAIRTTIVLGVAALLGWWFFRPRPVSGVQFTVKEVSSSGGNAMSFRVTSKPLRFFEGPTEVQPLAQRQYTSTFAAGATRYLYPEISLTYEQPGKELRIPLTCAVVRDGGQIITNIAVMARIQPNWETSSHTQGWGTERGGGWEPGRYRFDCRYGDKLVARDWIDVVGGGAAPQAGVTRTPPPTAPPAAPVQPTGAVGALAAIRARVSSLKLFPSSATMPPSGARDYATTFQSASTSFIGIEVTLAHQAPGQIVNTVVTCRFESASQKEVGRLALRYQIQPEWTGTMNAANWGRESPGFWTTGRYSVTCDDDAGRMLGRVGFTVR